MEDIKKCMNIFNEYVKSYDFKNKCIANKFHHTYRVMGHAKDISESLNLSEEDVALAEICSLFHDISRFEQITKYNTFLDLKSFDHGDRGYEIIKEFINDITSDEEHKNIILKAIKNHNKIKIENGLTDREILFCNITRDADKLDIMLEQAYSINDSYYELKQDILGCIYNKELVKNKYISNDIDHVLRVISFIFDINYKYSLNIVKDIIIAKKFELLEANIYNEEIRKLKNFVNSYLEERIDELC